jgi:DNA-binding transcriptional LysR family regulator
MRSDRYQEMLVFVQIAKSGSFSSAARALDLTPSTISKVVTRLERKFGARLFNRTTHSVRLSEEGKALFQRASRVIEAMTEADTLIEKFSSAPAGQLRVYALPSFALSQLAPVIPEFLDANPGIRIDIQLGTENIDSISSDIDVVLRYGRPENSRLTSRKVADSSWVICASPIYLERRGIPETPTDLVLHNCLSFSLRTMTVPWSFKSIPEGLGIEGNATSNHAPMLRELALRAVGIIRVADFVVANDIRSGALVPLLSAFISNLSEPIFALYQPQPGGSQRIRAFTEFLHRKFSRRRWLVSPR